MKTKTVGELLKDERVAHRLSLDELAKRTRIRLEYLEALEENRFELLPAATFVKGYIKTYGRILGFDAQPLLALLRRDYKESARGQLIPREFIKPVLKRQAFFTPVTMVVMVLALMFMSVMSYVGFQWYNLNKPPALEVFTPEENANVASKIEVTGRTNPDAIVVVNAQPVALQPDGTFTTEVYIPREGIASVTVEASDRRGKSNLVQRTVHVSF
jgi:cytoskeletal protein RodZ